MVQEGAAVGFFIQRPACAVQSQAGFVTGGVDFPQFFDAEQVPLNISASDIPSTVELGEPISIYWIPEPQDAASLSTPELLLTGVFLRSIDRKSANFGNGLAITVSVDNSQVQRLLAGTSNGRLVIVKSNG